MEISDETIFNMLTTMKSDLDTLKEGQKNQNNFLLSVKRESVAAADGLQNHIKDPDAHAAKEIGAAATSSNQTSAMWISVVLNFMILGATCVLAFKGRG